jgi:UDP-glucose 6-dehydrogenase
MAFAHVDMIRNVILKHRHSRALSDWVTAMRVAMIRAGHIGAVSDACIADSRHHVVCVDKDVAKIAALEGGEIPIYEPGLHRRNPIIGAASARSGKITATRNQQ